MSLQARLLALVASLITLLLLASMGMFYSQMSQQIRANAREALGVAQATFRLLQEHNRERLEMAAAALEQEPGFRNVLRTHDQATTQDYLSEVLGAFRVDLVTATDRSGQALVTTQPVSELEAKVHAALQGEQSWEPRERLIPRRFHSHDVLPGSCDRFFERRSAGGRKAGEGPGQ